MTNDPVRSRHDGPVNRWFIRVVWSSAAPLARITWASLAPFGVLFAVIAVVAATPVADAWGMTEGDREFFPFIAVFFLVLALLAALTDLVKTIIRRARA